MATDRDEIKRVVTEVINNTEHIGKQMALARLEPRLDIGMLLIRTEGLAWQIHHLAKIVEQLVGALDG